MKFNPIYKPNQLITGTGRVAIVTGWTAKEAIAKRLDPSHYAVVGQLYSPTRGLNFLIRNLLANPHVRGIVILDATKEDKNAGGCQCLLDFFKNGVKLGISDTGRKCWLVNSDVVGYIDQDVSHDEIELLRSSFAVYDVSDRADVLKYAMRFHDLEDFKSPYGEPCFFPYDEPVAKAKPGPLYGHRIEGETIAETWIKILHLIRSNGVIRPTGYDGKWQELIDLVAIVTDEPEDFYFPEPNYLPLDGEYLRSYIPQIIDDAPYREGVKYTYGQRLRSWFGRDQIKQVIDKLIKEIDSASAVMSLWDSGSGNSQSLTSGCYSLASGSQLSRSNQLFFDSDGWEIVPNSIDRGGRSVGDSDHNHGGSPCLNHIWVRVVDNELSLTATFRSNDMFSAWPVNAMGLRALQWHIRNEIASQSDYALAIGPLITISQSAHIYDDCWENADRTIASQYNAIAYREIKKYDDEIGNFLVEWNNAITVQRLTKLGELVESWQGINPLNLIREIAIAVPSISPAHIGYLGLEIQKAYLQKETYTQDRS